jgi:hypothetical protein
MKKPSRKRKKEPAAAQPVQPASPFDPIPVKPSRRTVRKEKKAAEARSKPVPEPKAPKVKRKDRPKGERKRLRGALGAPFRLLGMPLRKLGGLRGRTRIVVYGLIAIVLVFLALQLRGGPDDEHQVRAALARYETASSRKDYQTLCDDLLSKSYVRQTASSGLPCEVALRTALEDVRNPTLRVLGVKVDGDKATARVRGSAAGQVPGEASYTLVHEDGAWRIQPPRSGSPSTP